MSFYTVYTQQLQAKKDAKIRLIEKQLENFYRPLKNLFIGYKENPIDCFEKQKDAFHKIGCYRHLAEKNTLRFFENCTGCPTTNDDLKELLIQVRDDIDKFQEEYTGLI